jgi:hypothetical protein
MGFGPLGRDQHREAARIITDALLNAPGWLAVGPSGTRHRRFVAQRFHRAALTVTQRHGGPSYGAFRDGRLAGVAVTVGAGPLSAAVPHRSPLRARLSRRRPGGPSSAVYGPAPSRTAATRSTPTSTCGSWRSTRSISAAGSAARSSRACVRRPTRPSTSTLPTRRSAVLRESRVRGDRSGRASAQHPDVVHEASLSRCASGSPSSFFSVLFSIWRIRSRVTPKARPTSSSVRAL